jgi:hypothetical protein
MLAVACSKDSPAPTSASVDCTSATSYARTNSEWDWRPAFVNDNLRAVASQDGHFGAVGDRSMTKRSATGWVWHTIGYNGGADFFATTWLGDATIDVGSGPYASYDGFDLIADPDTHQQYALRGMASSGGLVVAVGDHGELVTTPDGLTWTRETPIADVRLNDVLWTGREFVAVGEHGAMYQSSNGRSWARLETGRTDTINAIATRDDQFFIATVDGYVLHGSGRFWGVVVDRSPQPIADVASGPKGVVAVGPDGLLMTSPDGECWEQVGGVTNTNLWSVAADQGFVAVGDNGTILQSKDGRNWFARPPGGTIDLGLVKKFGSTWIATGNDYTILTSIDGRNWTPADVLGPKGPIGSGVSDLTYAQGHFVAVATDGIVLSSPDGTQWTRFDTGTAADFSSIVWAFGQFFASRYDGVIMAGPDETSLVALPVSTHKYAELAASNGFIAVLSGSASGAGGTAGLWSSDGVQWSASIHPVPDYVQEIIGTNQGFLTVSASALYSSANGDRWTRESKLPFPAFTLAADGNIVMVAGAFGQLAVSSDRRTWTMEDTGAIDKQSDLFGIALDPNGAVAVGSGSLLLYRAR